MLLTSKLAWMQCVANWRAGELKVLLLALILAVSSITAVSAFSQRIATHLNGQGAILLGGDLAITGDQPADQKYIQLAKSLGLNYTQTVEFPSMVSHGEVSQLAQIKAIEDNFPLRGDFTVQQSAGLPKTAWLQPKEGEVWVDARLMQQLSLSLGDQIDLGVAQLKVAGLLLKEPSRGGDMFSFAPRLMMNRHDLVKTELIQFGSRIKYQLLVAGSPPSVQSLMQSLKTELKPGERIEDIKSARPEIKSALDKADTFLGLAAMVSALLAVLAMLLSAAPLLNRNIETFAMLRCFGAPSNLNQQILLTQTLMIALAGGVLGGVLGYFLQEGLAVLMANLLVDTLAPVTAQPFVVGVLLSVSLMLALMWPHLASLKSLPTVQILRRDIELSLQTSWRYYIPISLLILGLIWMQAKTVKLALLVSGGVLLTTLIVGFLAFMLINVLYQVRMPLSQLGLSDINATALQIGLTNLKRRMRLSVAQMMAFSLSLFIMILLSIVRADLMDNWQASLPPDAPNQFVINLQKDQVNAFKNSLSQIGLHQVSIHPMVRGRLVSINGHVVSDATYQDERAKRLVTREFNLSWSEKMQADNRLIQGRWWDKAAYAQPLVSLEDDLAKTLHIQLGDKLQYNIGGQTLTLTVSSIRKVEWDSMRANFFAVTPPGVLDHYAATYMTAFYLPPNQASTVHQWLKQYPNITLIDVEAIMLQVREIMHKMANALTYVFLLSIASAFAVLYAALLATSPARVRESTLLRVLGGEKKQVAMIMLSEFVMMALVAVLVAVFIANISAYILSVHLLEIKYQLNVSIVVLSFILALICIPMSAWVLLRRHLNVPPKQLLNSI